MLFKNTSKRIMSICASRRGFTVFCPSIHSISTLLKEKLPQAFMQIGWKEGDFRNLTTVWANLENPIKRGFINFVYVALSGGTLLISVMSQQYNSLMELYTHFYKILLFMKMYLPSSFILVRAEMNVHAFMNELDQKDYWYPRKVKKNWKSMYKVNGELSSCHDITDSGIVPSREGDVHNFA